MKETNTNKTLETMKTQVRNQLKEAGYSDNQIDKGFEYAEQEGYNDKEELGSLALSRILYSDSQLERGTYFDFQFVN